MKIYYPKDKYGNDIGFRTPESYVYDEDGKNLSDKIIEMNSAIDERAKTTVVNSISSKVATLEEDLSNLESSMGDTYATKTEVSDAKNYTDTKISELVGSAPETMDTLYELADAISEHQDVTDAITEAIGKKASTDDLTSHTGNSTIHITSTERTNWNDANTKKHTHSNATILDNTTASYTTTEQSKLSSIASGAQVNQNAFSNVVVGSTTIAADTTTDTLTLAAGSNITLTPDATNDKVTIAATNTTYSAATTSAAGLMSASDKSKLDGITASADAVSVAQSLTSGTQVGTITVNGTATKLYAPTNTDTKNTAGSTNSSSKLFLVGATSQAANPQTYSHDTAYVGTDGHLYSNSKQTVNLSDEQALTNKTYNGYTLGDACAKGVDTTATSESSNLITSGAMYTALAGKAASSHTHSAYANQNAFSNVVVGSTTIAADTTTDTLTIAAGSNITLTPDATNDKLTIAATDTTYSAATTSAAGLMSASDKSKLDGITASADAVSVAQSLTSGTQVGTITVNGTATKLYAPTNTDTHYTSKNVVGATTATSNTTSALTNGNVYLNSVENGSVTSTHKISGSGATTVTTDKSGNIVISSTNTNTDTKVTQTVTTSDASYPLLLAPSGQTATATTTSYFDSGVTLNPSTNTIAANVSGSAASCTGNAATATKLATARNIKLTGDVTGSASFNGSADASISSTLASSGVTAGSYGPSANASPAHSGTFSVPYITVDAKGRVTAASTKTIKLPSDNNTDTKVTNTLDTTKKAYVTGTTSATTNTGTQVFDTGVYLDTTAGQLTATTFKGALSGNASTATKATQDASGNVITSTYATKNALKGFLHLAGGTSGSTGYVKIATITVTQQYKNSPIVIELTQRSVRISTTLYILFSNASTTDCAISQFRYMGSNTGCYLYKSGTGIFDLYVKKSESYDSIGVIRFNMSEYMGSTTVTWTDVHASSLPDGCVAATVGGNVEVAKYDPNGHEFTSYYATKSELEDMVIGGEQILRNSCNIKELVSESTNTLWSAGKWRIGGAGSKASTTTYEIIDITDAPIPDISKGVRISSTSDDVLISQTGIPMIYGDTYTASCYVRVISGTPLFHIGSWKSNSECVESVTTITNTDWKKYSLTFVHNFATYPDETNMYFGNDATTECVIEMCGMKLERGDKATDGYMSKYDLDTTYASIDSPVFTSSVSMGRKSSTTVGENSIALGYNCTASGSNSFATGKNCTASGNYSYAGGYSVKASGTQSHAEGGFATASGILSHAEGNCTASGDYSHAEGNGSTASGNYSHAEGNKTTALAYQHAQGHYNNTSLATAGTSSGTGTGTAFVIGNGSSSSASNAFRVNYNGAPYSKSALTTTGCDYAEFFEWEDGNEQAEDRRGYFVTIDGEKIKIANKGDYILGIVSAMPSVIGNGDEDWLGRYTFDDFGAFVYEDFEYEEEIPETIEKEVVNEETGETETIIETIYNTETKTGQRYKENPDYDPTQKYIQRADRPEWDTVGMLGVLVVRDDGSCQVNGFCEVADGGIATASDTGYRVVKRVNDNLVKVIFTPGINTVDFSNLSDNQITQLKTILGIN